MAKTSAIVRNERRRRVVAQHADRRRLVKALVRSPATAAVDRAAAQAALQRLPRDASPTRLRNRDVSDGRPRGHLRRFGLSRTSFRDMAHRGELPGVRKASW